MSNSLPLDHLPEPAITQAAAAPRSGKGDWEVVGNGLKVRVLKNFRVEVTQDILDKLAQDRERFQQKIDTHDLDNPLAAG